MITFIPAQPGYFAIVKEGGVCLHLPVIAWRITEPKGILASVEVDAVGVGGLFPPECLIYGPDGKQAHE